MTNEIQVHILAEYFLPQTKDFWRGGGGIKFQIFRVTFPFETDNGH